MPCVYRKVPNTFRAINKYLLFAEPFIYFLPGLNSDCKPKEFSGVDGKIPFSYENRSRYTSRHSPTLLKKEATRQNLAEHFSYLTDRQAQIFSAMSKRRELGVAV